MIIASNIAYTFRKYRIGKPVVVVLFLIMHGSHSRGQVKDTLEFAVQMITVGFLQGGGSLIGADYETLVYKRMGLQVGAGFWGYDAGITLHLKSHKINSSSLVVSYLHQGIEETYVQSLLGYTIVLRARRLFSLQIGIGSLVEKGALYDEAFKGKEANRILLYSAGIYFTD